MPVRSSFAFGHVVDVEISSAVSTSAPILVPILRRTLRDLSERSFPRVDPVCVSAFIGVDRLGVPRQMGANNGIDLPWR